MKMKKLYAIVFICITAVVLLVGCSEKAEENSNKEKNEYSTTVFAMDTVMDIKVYASDEQVIHKAEDEIKTIEELMSRTNENSEIYKLNNNETDKLSAETRGIIRDATEVSERTGGAFDITVTPIMDLWGFSDKNFRVPDDDEIKDTLEKVDYRKIIADESGNVKKDNDTRIDLGGIAKGHTSDMLMKLFRDNDVSSAIVSLGGNVQTLGKKNDGELWKVAIQNPFDENGDYMGIISTSDEAVVTSGGYQRYFEENGEIYHHIIDTKSGYPAKSGLSSVTVICGSGETADGLSTAVFVMGFDDAVKLWKDSDDFELVLVKDSGEVFITEGIEERFKSDHDYEIIRRN